MKTIQMHDLTQISGGEIVPGYPSPDTVCSDIKLLVASIRGEAGADIGAATRALIKHCGTDFWSLEMAHDYVTYGGVPVPPATV